MEVEGFLVHSWVTQGQFRAAGRLADGQSFAVVDRRLTSKLSVGRAQGSRAENVLSSARIPFQAFAGESFDGQPLCFLKVPAAAWSKAHKLLIQADCSPAHEVPLLAENYRTERGLRGTVKIQGEFQRGHYVDLVFTEPELGPSATPVTLHWLSLDIETARDGEVRAVALAVRGHSEVLFRPNFPDEATLLNEVTSRVRALDPDVLTGWNVLDFDLAHLAQRYQRYGIPFTWGRTDEAVEVKKKPGARSQVLVSGRQALDAMRIARMSGTRFEDQSLDTVAAAVLGTGKTVSLKGEEKLAELDRLYEQDPATFSAYCQRDAELVLEILEKTGLDELTVSRAALTGVELTMAWTSIPPFEKIYEIELAARSILPPPKPHQRVSGASGGMVLVPKAGLFDEVQVFDFRSLYPSLIRTFGIDPLAQARAVGQPESAVLRAPNGAAFLRERGILPRLIDTYFAARMEAQKAGDETASYVYKILMNSFYGVLGSGSCRYGRTDLAGAITTFGRKYLEWARTWFSRRGLAVLYGDTDSVFVPTLEGPQLAQEFNADLKARILEEYGVESFLELRAEKRYRCFLIPRMRNQDTDRGRAKGYAGWLEVEGKMVIDVKGMEAIRSDWTPLARRIQTELLERLFRGEGLTQLEAWRQELLRNLRLGLYDAELVYRKALRRNAENYTANEPPQVKAARLLGWSNRRGRIEYLMTSRGPQPVGFSDLKPDYEHYLQHQLRPFWDSLVEAAGLKVSASWDTQGLLPF